MTTPRWALIVMLWLWSLTAVSGFGNAWYPWTYWVLCGTATFWASAWLITGALQRFLVPEKEED